MTTFLAFLIYLFLFMGLFGALFESGWGKRRYGRTLFAYVPIAFMLISLPGAADMFSGGFLPLFIAPPLARYIDRINQQHEATQREAARQAEAQRQADRAAQAQRQREQEEREAAQQASAERAAFEAQRAKAKEAREQALAAKALRGHLDVMTGAARALRADPQNPILLTTIDDEIKAIARNERITRAMLAAPDVTEDIRLLTAMLEGNHVTDTLLLTHIRQVFHPQAA